MQNILRYLSLFIFLILSSPSHAQLGGKSTFQFLNLVGSAHSAALGGNAIATRTDDVTLVYQNPSLLRESMDQHLAFNYVGYVADVKFGDVAYAQKIGKMGMYAGNLHFINYGTFDRTDENGNVLGTFNAGEYALSLSWSKALDSSFFIGATLKGILSDFDEYKSNAVAADIAATYYNDKTLWCAALVVKNVGSQLQKYADGDREPLPFEIQAGVSKQLLKAPFRFSFIAQHLEKFDLTYNDPLENTTDPLTGETKTKDYSSFEKAMRHMIMNVEVLFSKNFNVRFGYNFLRRNELGLPEKKGLSGLSAGFGFRVSKFQLSYARSVYNAAGGSNTFTITTNFHSFKRAAATTN